MSSRRRASRTRPWRCLPIQRATPVRVRPFAVCASSLAHRGRAAARRTRYWKWPPAQSLHSQSLMNTLPSSLPQATETRSHGAMNIRKLRVLVSSPFDDGSGRPERRRGAWLVAVNILLSTPLQATTVAPADFNEMVNGSQVIVHGAVVDVRAHASGGRGTIETVITVTVVTALKGHAPSAVVFRVPGGQIGRYRRVMVGAPTFTPGEEVVLFLSGPAPAMPMPFGLHQGVYRVARSAGSAMVTPVVPDGAGRVVRGDPARRPLALDAFARSVRAIVERAQ